jgi:hypothetical protein
MGKFSLQSYDTRCHELCMSLVTFPFHELKYSQLNWEQVSGAQSLLEF